VPDPPNWVLDVETVSRELSLLKLARHSQLANGGEKTNSGEKMARQARADLHFGPMPVKWQQSTREANLEWLENPPGPSGHRGLRIARECGCHAEWMSTQLAFVGKPFVGESASAVKSGRTDKDRKAFVLCSQLPGPRMRRRRQGWPKPGSSHNPAEIFGDLSQHTQT
jgi:hypothetical protein